MSGFSLTAPRTLNEIAKVDMLEQETPEAVKAIWAEFHQDPNLMAIATSMTGAQHETLKQRVAKCPNFIFPVFASKEAYYLMFSQVHACITRAAASTATSPNRLTSRISAIDATNTSRPSSSIT
jgi:ATP synthase F1 complex assembly factor 1